jgi:cysteine desulfurase
VIANGAQVTISGDDWQLGGHCHLRYPGISAETMLIRLDRAGVSASSGAACSSGSVEPSHVLLACGWLESMAKEGLRFSFGPGITASDAISAAMRVAEAAEAIRMSQSK